MARTVNAEVILDHFLPPTRMRPAGRGTGWGACCRSNASKLDQSDQRHPASINLLADLPAQDLSLIGWDGVVVTAIRDKDMTTDA